MRILETHKYIARQFRNKNIYYFLLAAYIALLVISSYFVYAQYLPGVIIKIPKFFIVSIFLCKVFFQDWRHITTKSKCLFLFLLCVFVVESRFSHTTTLAQLFILSAGCSNLDFRKIIKTVLIVEASLVISIVFLSLLHILPNWTYSRGPGTNILRQSLGFQYSTYVSIATLILTFYYLYSRQKSLRLSDYALLVTINLFAYAITDTRLTLLLAIIAMSGFAIINAISAKKMRFRTQLAHVASFIAKIIIPCCMAIAFIPTLVYTPNNPLSAKINTFTSDRLRLGNEAIEKYGINLIGDDIPWVGLAQIREKKNQGAKFNIVDSTYVYLPIQYGVIISIIFLASFYIALRTSIQLHNYYLAFILSIYACWAITDPQLAQLQWNVFALLFFSTVLRTKRPTETNTKISLDELHKIQFSMLKKFAKFCNKNNLTYYLCGGTLLGAVRHKGFIPWDDDVDILMPRPDYERFIILTSKNNYLGKDIVAQTPSSTNPPDFPFIKIYDSNYEVQEEFIETYHREYIWLDVFPIDGLSPKTAKNTKLYQKIHFWRKLYTIRQLKSSQIIDGAKTKLKAALKPFVKFLIDIMPTSFYTNKINKLSQTYPYETSKYVGGVMWGYGPQERMLKKDVEKKVLVEFEGEKFYTFSCYEEYLTNLYGDYMQLPPEDERQTHLVSIIKAENNKEQE